MKRSAPPRRRTPLRSVGRKAQREEPALSRFREIVHARTWCELNTPACPPSRHEGHHAHHVCIADRRRGVHDPDRGLLACADGHRYVHDHPAESYERGWLIRDGVPA